MWAKTFNPEIESIDQLPFLHENICPVITDECKELMIKNWRNYEGSNF